MIKLGNDYRINADANGYARSATRHRVEYNALELKDVKQLIKELKDEIGCYRIG